MLQQLNFHTSTPAAKVTCSAGAAVRLVPRSWQDPLLTFFTVLSRLAVTFPRFGAELCFIHSALRRLAFLV